MPDGDPTTTVIPFASDPPCVAHRDGRAQEMQTGDTMGAPDREGGSGADRPPNGTRGRSTCPAFFGRDHMTVVLLAGGVGGAKMAEGLAAQSAPT